MYVGGGVGILVGVAAVSAGLSTSNQGNSRCDDVNEGTACGFGSFGDGLVGGALTLLGGALIAASVGLEVVAIALPTRHDAVSSSPATAGTVTAPGLKPASVTLR